MADHHMQLAVSESADAATSRFERWCAEVERLAGIDSLDGDQNIDGYSIDYAHDAFRSGEAAGEYAATIRARRT